MRTLGFVWGIVGVLLLLSFAIFRLAPIAFELGDLRLSAVHRASLAFSIVYMAYAEGYKGFHRGFSPRVIQRANYLRENPRWHHVLLAPAFCMGYIYATRRRQILSIGLTLVVMGFVVVARQLPQPWRGILDAGVVTGLGLGGGGGAGMGLRQPQRQRRRRRRGPGLPGRHLRPDAVGRRRVNGQPAVGGAQLRHRVLRR